MGRDRRLTETADHVFIQRRRLLLVFALQSAILGVCFKGISELVRHSVESSIWQSYSVVSDGKFPTLTGEGNESERKVRLHLRCRQRLCLGSGTRTIHPGICHHQNLISAGSKRNPDPVPRVQLVR